MDNEVMNACVIRFLETFKVCGTFLYDYNDEDLEYLLFEKFDDHIIVDLSEEALNNFVENNIITQELKNLCLELREISISVLANQNYECTASFVRNSYVWRHIFKFTDYIKEQIHHIHNDFDLSPITLGAM